MIGAHAMVSKDVIPFSLIVGMRPVLSGVNLVGLKRRGYEKETIKKLVELFAKIFERQGKKSFQERLEAIDKDNMYENNEVQKVLEFMKKESARSFVAPKSKQFYDKKKKNWTYFRKGQFSYLLYGAISPFRLRDNCSTPPM